MQAAEGNKCRTTHRKTLSVCRQGALVRVKGEATKKNGKRMLHHVTEQEVKKGPLAEYPEKAKIKHPQAVSTA